MDMKNHIACSIAYCGFRVACCIVQEMVDGCVYMLSRFGLGGCNGVESDELGTVNGSIIEQKSANHLLNPCFSFRIQEWRGVRVICILYAGSIVRDVIFMWGVLTPCGDAMLEFIQGFFNITRHGEIYIATRVVPFKCQATVRGASNVCGD